MNKKRLIEEGERGLKKEMKILFAVFVSILFFSTVSATTYYVAPNGSNSNSGTSVGQPWLTLDYALSYASLAPGDIIQLAEGTHYPASASTDKNGSLGNPIIIRGAGANRTILIDKLTIDMSFYEVYNLSIRDDYLRIDSGAGHINISNCEFSRSIAGVSISGGASPGTIAGYITVRNSEFHHPTGNGMISNTAHNSTFENNLFRNNAGYDVIRENGGGSSVYRNNTFIDIVAPASEGYVANSSTSFNTSITPFSFNVSSGLGFTVDDKLEISSYSNFSNYMIGFVTSYTGNNLTINISFVNSTGVVANDWRIRLESYGNHADIIQSFVTSANQTTSHIVFEKNKVFNSTGQLGNLEDHSYRNTTVNWLRNATLNWTFRNNLLVNSRIQLNNEIVNVSVYGNTIFNSAGYSSGFGTMTYVYNNIFINISGTSSGGGAYTLNGFSPWASADYNIFTNASGHAFTGLSAGANSINGDVLAEDLFMNYLAYDFRLKLGSVAIDSGTSLSEFFNTDIDGLSRPQNLLWDIGAYEYNSSAIGVLLTNPVNYLNSTSNSITFNCSAQSGSALTNITLYGDWGSGWHANQTVSVTGLANSTNFTKSLPEGSYSWNCLAYDNSSSFAFASLNRTVTVDQSNPIVSLVYPSNNTFYNNISQVVNFTFNVTDVNNILSCSLILDGLYVKNVTAIQKNINQTISRSVLNGLHNWSVGCTDIASNSGNSSMYNLSVSYTDIIKPSFTFVNPTPPNGNFSTQAFINVSVSEENEHFTFVDFDRDVKLWLRMDDVNNSAATAATGNGVNDSSTYGLNFTAARGAVQNDSGRFGKGFMFNNSALLNISHLTTNLSTMGIGGSSYAISFWVYNEGSGDKAIFQITNTTGTNMIYVEKTNTDRISFAQWNNTGTKLFDFSGVTTAFPISTWLHVVVNFNVSSHTQAEIYFNGTKVLNQTVLNASTPIAPGLITVGRHNTLGRAWVGLMDEIIVFNRSLTNEEILSLYNAVDYQYQRNFTIANEGIYSYRAYSSDIYGNSNLSSQRTLTIDRTKPTTSASIPSNSSTLNSLATIQVAINSTDSSAGVDSVIARLTEPDLTQTDYVLTNSIGNKFNTSVSLGETLGSYNITFIVNDTAGNINDTTTVYFSTLDATAPTVTISAPENTSYSSVVTTIQYTLSEEGNVCWYTLNGGTTNTTVTCETDITGLSSSQGSNTWTVYANDSLNNVGSDTVTFFYNGVDSTQPLVQIVYPGNTTYNTNVSAINYTASDTNLAYCWYSNETTNFTQTSCGTNFTGVITREGSNRLTVYANDSSGNINSTSVTFFKDTVHPQFTNYTSNSGTLTTSGTGTFNVSLANSNGTVLMQINNINYSASNLTATNYNLSVSLSSAGSYTYYWYSFSNSSLRNFNSSTAQTYTVNSDSTDSGSSGSGGGGGGGGGGGASTTTTNTNANTSNTSSSGTSSTENGSENTDEEGTVEFGETGKSTSFWSKLKSIAGNELTYIVLIAVVVGVLGGLVLYRRILHNHRVNRAIHKIHNMHHSAQHSHGGRN